MHPDQIPVVDILGDRLGEEPIGLAIGLPGGLIEDDLTWMVMEEGPQGGIYDRQSNRELLDKPYGCPIR